MSEQLLDLKSMEQYAQDFVRTLTQKKGATVVALTGDLGAGKTTFVQNVARALGITEVVTSPTFVIQKTYLLVGQCFKKLIHIDAYRLKSTHELEVLGWKEIVADRDNLICIEWPERVPGALPVGAIGLHLRFIDEQTRGIERVTVGA